MNIRIDHTILKAPQLQTIDLSYRRGENVYEKGAPAQFVHQVIEGALFRFKMSPGNGGRRSIIQFLFPGDAFGYEPSRRHCDTVEALTDAKVRSVGREALLEAATISPRVSKALSSAAFWAARAAEDQSIACEEEMRPSNLPCSSSKWMLDFQRWARSIYRCAVNISPIITG